jgi:hypothetical protein
VLKRAEYAGGEGNDGPDELERAFDGDSDETERQEEEPHERIEEERHQR